MNKLIAETWKDGMSDDDKVIAELMKERNRIMQEIFDTLKRNEQIAEQILDKQRNESHSEKN